jgi:hypothetical protein
VAIVFVLVCLAGAAGVAHALSHRHPGTLATAANSMHPALTRQGRVVRKYFAAINSHRYLLAYHLRGDSGSFKDFMLGFTGTAKDIVTIKSVNGDVVTATLVAKQTDGTEKTYAGTYTVVGGVIRRSDVHQVS